jgi:hypothetical protein
LEFGIIITSNLILFFERIKKMSIAINLKTFTDKISDRDFERLCADNPETKFETTKDGKLIVMSPTGSLTGQKDADLIYQVQAWNPQSLFGEELMPGLIVDLLRILQATKFNSRHLSYSCV